MPVLPSTGPFPLLVLGLDQGSQGAAGAAFMEGERKMMVWCRWDKYHRCVRDIKLSLGHVAGGLFLKAQLFTAYLWSMNFKPFQTGLLSTQKKEALDYFLATTQEESPIFLKYGPRIAEDNGLAFHSVGDRCKVYDSLPAIAQTFRQSKDSCDRTGVCSRSEATGCPSPARDR